MGHVSRVSSILNDLKKHSHKYLIFGDSFAFCRYVNDNETWEYFLENLIQMNVRNYGVGNFGVDQAILKYFLEYKNIYPFRVLNINKETINNDIESIQMFPCNFIRIVYHF